MADTLEYSLIMPNNARCAVGYCDNDKRYPDLFVKRSHVNKLVFHKWPQDPSLAEIWRKQVVKSRSDYFNPTPGAKGTFVCSNHFPLGEGRQTNLTLITRQCLWLFRIIFIAEEIEDKSNLKIKQVETRLATFSLTMHSPLRNSNSWSFCSLW